MAGPVSSGNRAELASVLTKAKDLQARILFVLGALIVYRLGTHIPIPGINAVALAEYQATLQKGLFGMFNMFSGGAFSSMAVLALGVMPYITSSIIMQLMTSISPSMAEMKKDGEAGQRRINQYTRYFAVILAFVQGMGLAIGMESATVTVNNEVLAVVTNPGFAFRLQTALTLTAGSLFLMWLGEQMTSRGIGNGTSVIIFAGIVAGIPGALFQTFEMTRVGSMSGIILLVMAALVVGVMMAVVFFETSQRRVLVQYPKRQNTMGSAVESSHMPLKLNMTGVIPAIFASSLLMVPISIAQFNPNAPWARQMAAWFAPSHPVHMVAFVLLVVFFCFFYTAVVFNSEETADNLKKNGGFVPGLRPGKATAEFFDYVLARLTVIGAVYMSAVCVLPQILISQMNVPFYFGGTSLLIVVSVTIDLVSRIQAHIIAQRYESLLKKSRLRGASKGGVK